MKIDWYALNKTYWGFVAIITNVEMKDFVFSKFALATARKLINATD